MARDIVTDEDLDRYGHGAFDDLYAACWKLIELENVEIHDDRDSEILAKRLTALEHAVDGVHGFFAVMKFFYDRG